MSAGRDAAGLAPWACRPGRSRGRRFAEPPAPTRDEHQRDRDRIVHSTAFRRLVYKTQVFVNHEGDLFRTRLTHSLEVAQVARSAARELRLNEDLVEAIALAHDLGHTPFGHAGQDALHACMAAHGGFEHNLQSLRVVDRLEQRYFAFDGLNLSFEAREGILKHCSRRNALRLCAVEPDGPARRFVDGGQPSLEAQLVNLADEIAYCTHDIDDGLRSGLLQPAQLEAVPLFARWHEVALDAGQASSLAAAAPVQPGRRLVFETLRRLLAALIADVVQATEAALAAARPGDVEAVRRSAALVSFSLHQREEVDALKHFLFGALYRHAQVTQTTSLAQQVITELFEAYRARPQEMPADFAATDDVPRAVADYIAGMTDRFALREHERLTGRRVFADL
ncbi:MAG: deoxyguanosinetriphosphate triphosphohydrolase [Burkholderiales bacterium]|nr:deoxyguanosinetriphosphate triphosphohydrolase [Burkholderiales bacterium]